jgi:hypothetical protein
LKDKVRLVIEKGATGITVSVNAGATCWLEDYNGAVKYFYSSGSLVWKENLATGEFWWGSSNRTDTLAYPEQTASYIVFQDGSYTKMKNGTTGQIDAYSTNASQIINWAMGNLTSGRTWQEIVYLKGNFSITSTILLPNFVSVLIDGSIHGDTMTTPIFKNDNQTGCNYGVSIQGVGGLAVITGNPTGGTQQKGISLVNAVNPPNLFTSYWTGYPVAYYLKNLMIKLMGGNGIDVDFTGSSDSQIGCEEVSSCNVGGYAVHWFHVYDSYYYGGIISADVGFFLQACSGCILRPTFMNNVHVFHTCDNIDFSCQFIDQTNFNNDTIWIMGCTYSRFHDSTFHNGDFTNNTYSAIVVMNEWGRTAYGGQNSTYNIFSDITFDNYLYTSMWKYGIEEDNNSSDYNLFYGLNGKNIGTAIVKKAGANSKADTYSIIGTIVS